MDMPGRILLTDFYQNKKWPRLPTNIRGTTASPPSKRAFLLLDHTGMNSRPLHPDTTRFVEEMATRITEANPKGDEVHLPVEEWARTSFEADRKSTRLNSS